MLQSSGPTNAPINYSGLNVGSSMWNVPIPIFWGRRRLSTNAIGFYNFTAHAVNGKGKGAAGKPDQQKTYTADCLLALGEGIIDEVTNNWADGSTTTVSTLADLGMIFFSGSATQAPWSLMVSQFPSHALAYALTSYLAAPGLKLGESATIPDNAFEAVRIALFSSSYVQQNPTGGWINPSTHQASPSADCLMSDIITDFLTSGQYGMGFVSGDLGSITQYAAYQRAQGLFFSPLLVQQEKGNEIINRWALLSNSWIYEAAGQVQLVPLGDSVVTGNSVTYTPVQDVAADLTLADFIGGGKGQDPVKVTRIDPADAHNRTCLSFTDRTLGYIDNPVEWKADGLADRFGLRDDSTTSADDICDPAVAAIVVQLLGKRAAYIRNTYDFKVSSRRGILWLPGTILTLSAPNVGTKVRVRVKTIDRDEKRQLSVSAEEFPGTTGTYYPPVQAPLTASGAFTTSSTTIGLSASAPSWLTTLVSNGGTVVIQDLTAGGQVGYVQSITGSTVTLMAASLINSSGSSDSLAFIPQAPTTTPVTNIAPGNVNTPAIIEPNSAFTSGVAKLIIAASGGVNWGGCTVNVSFDGTDYSEIGEITASARQGLLTATLATYGGANPDTTHTLAVDCAESLGTPAPVSNADAQANRTLSLIAAQPTLTGGAYVVPTNGELLSFGAVTATGTFAANLTYLERAQYGSAVSAHSIGDQFTQINVAGSDGTSIAYPLPAQYVGVPIYIKLCSFNVFGQALQDPSTVLEYKYTPTGAGFGGGTAGAPTTPTGLTELAGALQVTLAWNATPATDNVTSYTVWRAPGLSASFGSAAAIWTGQALGYFDTSVSSATSYTYFLTANNAIGASPNTAGVNATTTASTSAGGATSVVTISATPDALGAPPALMWFVDFTNSHAAPITIKLPATPTVGQQIKLTDVGGNAGTFAVTIQDSTGAALSPAASINVNNGWAMLRWNGSAWVQG